MSRKIEHRLPSLAEVHCALCHYYKTRRYRWDYKELYAELTGSTPDSTFSRRAQAHTRAEYPEFQSQNVVLTPDGVIRPDAVERQANAILQVIERAASEGWLPSGTDAEAEHEIELQWEGPYDLMDGGELGVAAAQTVARFPGVYLWAVEVNAAFHICYLGITERSFAERLQEEIAYELGFEKHKVPKHFDVRAFAQAKRLNVRRPEDPSVTRRDIDQLMAMTRIFMAPLACAGDLLKEVERELIHHLQRDDECGSFLANVPTRSSHIPLRLKSSTAQRLIGLEDLR